MFLLDFIKSHEDWEELLSKAPYCLKITRKPPYICFKYSQIDSDFAYTLVREARGVIFNENTWEVCARGFDKFFNYGEPNAAQIDFYKVHSITEKIDGSLFKLWFSKDDHEWHLSTNSTIDAADAPLNCALDGAPKNFYDLFTLALTEAGYYNFYDLMKDRQVREEPIMGWTFLFEVVSPYNRVVIPYEETKAYYLGARNNETGEWDLNNYFIGIQSPRNIAAKCPSLKRVVEIAESYPWTKEGFVVFDGVERIKIKSPEYVKAHYARTNGSLTLRALFEVIINNEIDEFLTYCSEYKEKIEELQHFMKVYENVVNYLIGTLNYDVPRKDFALQVQSYPEAKTTPFFAWCAFKSYDAHLCGETYSFSDCSKDFDGGDWEKVFKQSAM